MRGRLTLWHIETTIFSPANLRGWEKEHKLDVEPEGPTVTATLTKRLVLREFPSASYRIHSDLNINSDDTYRTVMSTSDCLCQGDVKETCAIGRRSYQGGTAFQVSVKPLDSVCSGPLIDAELDSFESSIGLTPFFIQTSKLTDFDRPC